MSKTKITAGAALVVMISGTAIISGVSASQEVSSGNVQGVRQEMKTERTQMNQEIHTDRMQMQQGIKTDHVEMKQKIEANRQEIQGNHQDFALNTGVLKDYFKNPLNEEERIVLKTIMMKQQADMDAIIKNTTLNMEDKQTKMQALMSVHMEAILPYIASDKLDAFKKFVAEKMQVVSKNQDLRKENKDTRQEFQQNTKEKRETFKDQIKQRVKALSEKLQATLIGALEKVPTDRKETVFKKVLANVENAVAKINANTGLSQERKDRILAQLQEIKSIVQDKLDELSGVGDATILNDVLSGTDTTTSASGSAQIQ